MGLNCSKGGGLFPSASSLRGSNHGDAHAAYAYGHGGLTYPHGQPSLSYPPPQQNYAPEQYHTAPQAERRYSRIGDDYNSLEQVTEALARAGLESSNLIIGIDFTKSNEWTGARSFNRKSLHHIGDGLNPYEQAISIIGKTLAAFDEDNWIPSYGFGDASTHDHDVFSFYTDRHCHGFEEVLSRYKEIVPQLRLSGPTSFSPIIDMAVKIVKQSGGQYHVLVIIADGQVTRSVDTPHGQLSRQEQKTIGAIVQASNLPLSIILVGVGDGPWDMMKKLDDNIPTRTFDNFQFVNFTEIMSKNIAHSRKEAEFALAALMEIPSQYKATIEFNILGSEPVAASAFSGSSKSFSASFSISKPYHLSGSEPIMATYHKDSELVSTRPIATNDSQFDEYYLVPFEVPFFNANGLFQEQCSGQPSKLCVICISNVKNMAFGCGHQTCAACSVQLQSCPICRSSIQTRTKLYL